MIRSLVFALLLSLPCLRAARGQGAGQATDPPAPAVRALRDIPYVPNGAPRQRLDLYLPAQPGAARPLVAYIHGGAWRAGSKSQCDGRPFIGLGYDFASIEYRFSQDAPYPAQIEDCKAAVRWLRAHAQEYGIDPKRIGVWGASAGGHLVALLGVTGNVHDFDTGPNLDQSSAVQCVVDFFGPSDLLDFGKDPAVLDSPSNAIDQLLGGPLSTHQALARAASPVYFVTPDAAPFLIFHGGSDPLVPLRQSQELNAALQKAGVESALEVIPGAGHGGGGFETPEVHKQIRDFFARHLQPQG